MLCRITELIKFFCRSTELVWVSYKFATLYNSNGVCVAQKEGAGSEIFLPADSKGTHILVVKAGGRVVKKKIALK